MRRLSIISIIFIIFNSCATYCTTTTELLNVNDLNYNDLNKYNLIDDNCAIYRMEDNNKIYPVYPVDSYTWSNNTWNTSLSSENKKLYDIKTIIERNAANLAHFGTLPNWSGGNLIIRYTDNADSNTYTMKDPKSYQHHEQCWLNNEDLYDIYIDSSNNIRPKLYNKHSSLKIRLDTSATAHTNIIVPYGITWSKQDLMLICGKYDNNSPYNAIQVNIIILGNILADDTLLQQKYGVDNFYPESNINLYWPINSKIIVGQKAGFLQNNTEKGVAPIYTESEYVDYIYYPGCIINRATYNSDISSSNPPITYITIGPNCKVYLNRYLIDEEYIDTTSSKYEENIADNNKLSAKFGQWIQKIYFASTLAEIAFLASIPITEDEINQYSTTADYTIFPLFRGDLRGGQ